MLHYHLHKLRRVVSYFFLIGIAFLLSSFFGEKKGEGQQNNNALIPSSPIAHADIPEPPRDTESGTCGTCGGGADNGDSADSGDGGDGGCCGCSGE